MSSILPITGYPFGPGGYSDLAFRRFLYNKTNEATTASDTPPRREMGNMEDGGKGENEAENSYAHERYIHDGRHQRVAHLLEPAAVE